MSTIYRAGTIKRDRRTKARLRSPHIMETVEAEAMPAGILRSILRTEIENLLPPDALAVARAEEQSAQDYFTRLAEIAGGAS